MDEFGFLFRDTAIRTKTEKAKIRKIPFPVPYLEKENGSGEITIGFSEKLGKHWNEEMV